MQVLVMDQKFNLIQIIDSFTSLIWNEYYIGPSDFELQLPMDIFVAANVKEGYHCSIKESRKYMIVEHIEVKTDVQEGDYYIISGRSLESILERRILVSSFVSTTTLREAFKRLINSAFNANSDTDRAYYNVVVEDPDDGVAEEEITVQFDAGNNILDCTNISCESTMVGYEAIPGPKGLVIFKLYNGLDRSYSQSKNPWVVFSSQFENLESSSMVVDTTEYKNCVYYHAAYNDKVKNEDGEEETVEKYISGWAGEAADGSDRYEMYYSSNLKPADVDKEAFGKPEDFVNKMDYMEWAPTYFDSDSYNQAVNEYDQKMSASAPTRREDKYEWTYNPTEAEKDFFQVAYGDRNHVSNVIGWVSEVIPGETTDEFNQRYGNWADSYERSHPYPSKDDFMRYDWVWIAGGQDLYNQALIEAQKKIDAEYQAAKDHEVEVCREAIITEALAELSKHTVKSSFDGEVDYNVNFIYGRDYYLGDIVQISNKYGYKTAVRVVSVIFSQDPTDGTKVIPTFQSDEEAVY